MRDYVAAHVNSIPPSGIRRFFDQADEHLHNVVQIKASA